MPRRRWLSSIIFCDVRNFDIPYAAVVGLGGMKPIQIVGVLVGAFIAALGLLWFLQGAAIIEMRPILCVANCEPIVGGSPFWAATGVIAFIIGLVVVILSARRRGT